jgi:dienelactone hydrolase
MIGKKPSLSGCPQGRRERHLARSGIVWSWTIVLLCVSRGPVWGVETLPASQPLGWSDDLAVRIVDEAHRWLDQKREASVAAREKLWRRDFSSKEAYETSIEPNREHFRKCIGAIDSRLPAAIERCGDLSDPALVSETNRYRVFQVRWPVLVHVWGEGLLLEPKQKPAAYIVAIPDADQTPEQIVGLAEGVPPSQQFARHLAENGCLVVVPVPISRACDCSGNPEIRMTNQPHREWIYRQAYEMGRHVIGYEVQKVLAAVDWFAKIGAPGARMGVAGYAEGGLIAFYSAAVDKRISACLVSGYFDCRQRVWEEPIYRNVWNLLREFGDAEIASLIAPRTLVVEQSAVPKIDGPPQVRGRSGAAPGRLWTPAMESVRQELARAATLDKHGFAARRLVVGPGGQLIGPGSPEALAALLGSWGRSCQMPQSADAPVDRRTAFDPRLRQKRQVEGMVAHVQMLQHRSDAVRDQWFLNKTDRRSAEAFARDAKKYRQIFRDEVIGSFDDPLLPPAPRTRRIYDEPKWTGYEVILDVWPGLHAWGILCLPKGIKPGERRPVVVCQHGLEGVPRDTIEPTAAGFHYYRSFAARLADQGFITFAPFNLYRGGDRFRMLRRKAAPLRASLFTIIAAQHQQILNWLGGLRWVDKSRIGFYGLSYGGVSAMRLPALLEGYALSICSANFNQWIHKTTSVEYPASYMFTGEWEMFDFDLGQTFNYAEMAYLIFPRPFMVERGHNDTCGADCWVEYEYAKIRRLYDTLGLGDRTAIEFFDGGHEIHGQGTFRFLQEHLNWPAPAIGTKQ